MKKFLIFLLIVFLCGSGFFIYQKYLTKEEIDIWDLVPSTALAVYESERTIQTWNELSQSNIWSNLSSITNFKKFNSTINLFDSLTDRNGSLDRLIREKKFLVSIHKTSIHTLDRIVYIPLLSSSHRKTLNTILNHYKDSENSTFQTTVFQNIEVSEVKHKATQTGFSYILYKNHFIASNTSFLIEDVIRNITDKFQVNFRFNNRDIFKVPSIKQDEGNLYVDLRQVSDLLKTFIKPKLAGITESLNWIGGSSYYDITLAGNSVFLNGSVTIPSDNHQYFLSSFYNQEPQKLTSLNLLPTRTASYLVYTYEHINEWRINVDTYWEDREPDLILQKADLLEELGVYERDFYDWIGNEMGIATLESVDVEKPEKLVFVKVSDMQSARHILDDMTMMVSYQIGDSVFTEIYQDITIRQIPIEQFPSRLFGKQFEGFTDCFYAPIEDFIIFGNSSDVLKSLISDIADENIWGKSVRIRQFLENTQSHSNIGLFINFSRAWNKLLSGLNQDWSTYISENSFQLKHWELYALQFSNVNQNFYSSQSLQHRQSTSIIQTPSEFFKEQVVVTEYPIITSPKVVLNHNDRSREIMVQDSANQVYLISSKGEILWKDSLEGSITGDIFQIDYYKNGKLQYLIPTIDRIYLIDRNGESVERYPIFLNDSISIAWFNVIDYNKSKNYRFMVTDHDGNIYLYDKYGNNLEGWIPREIGESLSSNPFHMRIRARDCMVAIQENGVINIFNRRGEMFKNFPIDLNYNLRGPTFVEKGADFQKTGFNVVLQTGEVIKFDLEGKITGKLQLYKPAKDSWFEIVPDATKRTYVIGRKDFNRISFLDKQGELIFDRELLASHEISLQYYNFGADNQIFVITDPLKEFTYFYNQEGKLINNQPIESSHKIGLIYSERNNKFNIYSCYGNQFTISSFYKQ